MIGRLLFCTLICLVIVSAILFLDVTLPPFLERLIGNFPGDMVWEYGNFDIPLPFGTAFIGGLVLTFILTVGR